MPLPITHELAPLLEQLATELIAAEADGSCVARPRIEQVWVEPGGRLQVLDFALPYGALAGLTPKRTVTRGAAEPPIDDTPLDFVRRVTSLALEGHPRRSGDRVKAPIPPPASRITDGLFANQYRSVEQLRTDLVENHALPATVTAGLRAAHLGAQGPMLAPGLFFMFFFSGLFSLFIAIVGVAQVQYVPREARDILSDPAKLEQARADIRNLPEDHPRRAAMLDQLSPDKLPDTMMRVTGLIERMDADNQDLMRPLTRPEQAVVRRYVELLANAPRSVSPRQAVELTLGMARSDRAPRPRELRFGAGGVLVWFVAAWPLVWAAFAFAFRGGVSMHIAGVALVRPDGRPAGRLRCAAREFLVWLPLTVLLLAAFGVQVVAPELVVLRTALWLLGVLLLPLYVVVALRDPSRPPQDRIVGTYLVPV